MVLVADNTPYNYEREIGSLSTYKENNSIAHEKTFKKIGTWTEMCRGQNIQPEGIPNPIPKTIISLYNYMVYSEITLSSQRKKRQKYLFLAPKLFLKLKNYTVDPIHDLHTLFYLQTYTLLMKRKWKKILFNIS